MGKDLNTQWHPAFCSAVKLELIENKGDLDYTNEYNLNSKPIQMDLLVIKKSSDVEIKMRLGIFSVDIILWSTSHRKLL